MNRTYQLTLDTFGVHPRFNIAVKLCVLILKHPPYLPLHKAAPILDISISYVEQITRNLRENKIVASQRGPGGGIYLLYDPKNLTLAKILDAMSATPRNSMDKIIRGYLDNCLDNISLWEVWQKTK